MIKNLSGRFYSIDPGVKHFGIARWRDGELERAWLHPEADLEEIWFRSDDVVVEMPQQDRRTRNVRMKNVLELAAAAGRIAARTDGEEHFVTPKMWKGSLPKDVCHQRVLARLSELEQRQIDLPPRKARKLDVLDAIGIGLYALGRLK